MDLLLTEYSVTEKNKQRFYTVESSVQYHVVFDTIGHGTYRIRFNRDKKQLEIIHGNGDDHKIYTFS